MPKSKLSEAADAVAAVIIDELDGYGEPRAEHEVWIGDANRAIDGMRVASAALNALHPPVPQSQDKLAKSLASYVSADDVGMDRMDFLRTVAARILDDIGV